jgi:RNA polymerase sigma-70 factor (ECF subfamily)
MLRPWDGLTDVELVALVSRGDLEAAACLYDRYAPTLLALSFRVVRDRSEAEDVVHDAFVTMADRASQYVPERGSVVAWLVTLVRNLSIDRTRRRERRGVILRSVVAEEPKVTAGNPEELLADARVHAKVRRALAKIPSVQRETLEFAFFEGLTYPEIAEREGIPVGTIKSRAARALSSLREVLNQENVDLTEPPHRPGDPGRSD